MSDRGFAGAALNGTWRINVAGRIYGPYTGHQIREFAAEGRVAPHSIVQAGETGPWITAIDDPVLALLFNRERTASVVRLHPAPGAGVPGAGLSSGEAGGATEKVVEEANYVIITQLKSPCADALDSIMASMGQTYRLNGHVWIMRSRQAVGAVRNRLVNVLGRDDMLFVVNATNGRSAWFNLGPTADVRVRAVWKAGDPRVA